jgi:hypothetical protein
VDTFFRTLFESWMITWFKTSMELFNEYGPIAIAFWHFDTWSEKNDFVLGFFLLSSWLCYFVFCRWISEYTYGSF